MKIKNKAISLVLSGMLLLNVVNVYADTQSIEQAWHQLSSTQQSKLQQVGIDTHLLNKIDSSLGSTEISAFIGAPVTYENGHFTVSQKDAETVLALLSMAGNTSYDKDSMLAVFNDVMGDINSTSSEDTKEDFARLLAQYGLCSVVDVGPLLPGVGGGSAGGSLKQENMQEKLEEKLENLKQAGLHTKEEVGNFQKALEVLSSYKIEPLVSLANSDVQKAWEQSAQWQQKNADSIVLSKAITPVARWNMLSEKEVVIPKGLWEETVSYGRVELDAGVAVVGVEKNTFANNGSKLTIESFVKEGYKSGITFSSTSKIYSPAKIGFYIEGEDVQDYAVYKLEDNMEILIGGIYNEARDMVEAFVKSSGTYVLKKAPAKTYEDLENVSWAKKEIEHLGQKGYIGGKSEGIYAPLDDITRAEFAALLTRMFQLPSASVKNNFGDIKTDAWYYNDVMATVEAKLFNGKSASSFDPSGKITRQEVAAVISRILVQKGYSEPKTEQVGKGIWAPGALALMNDQSLTTKVPGFNDNVAKNANRAEVAYMLYNLLQR